MIVNLVDGTALEQDVKDIMNDYIDDDTYECDVFMSDLMSGGCQSGMISELVYYEDTLNFYNKHKSLINTLLNETMKEYGVSSPSEVFGDKWDDEDPLCQETTNQNLLAWFAFESTAYSLACANGYKG